jgi:hypothetical protein
MVQRKCNGGAQRAYFRHIKSSFSRILPADSSAVFARRKLLRPVSVSPPVSFFSRKPRFFNSSALTKDHDGSAATVLGKSLDLFMESTTP